MNPQINDDGVSVKGCSTIYAPRGQAGEYAPETVPYSRYYGAKRTRRNAISASSSFIVKTDASERVLAALERRKCWAIWARPVPVYLSIMIGYASALVNGDLSFMIALSNLIGGCRVHQV